MTSLAFSRVSRASASLCSRMGPVGAAFLQPNKQTAMFQYQLARALHVSAARHGQVTFKLADIGEGIAEVELLKFYKNVGDHIDEMEAVCEVQSDKAAVEITSRFAGQVKKIYWQEGQIIKIGAPLMDIETEGGAHEAGAAHETEKAPVEAPKADKEKAAVAPQHPTTTPGSQGQEVEAAPAVRRVARELGVDLSQVHGTGKGGRITKEDVEAFAKGGAKAAPAAPTAAPSAAAAAAAPIQPVKPAVHLASDEVKEVALKGYGRAMAKSMTESLKVPHMNLGEEVDLTELVELRGTLRASFEKAGLKAPTVTPFIIKAISMAMGKHPIINSKFNPANDSYKMFGAHNVSVAIDTPNGLVVPTIKNCEALSVVEIQQELMRLQQLAAANKLQPNDLTGGTVSISNVGVIGGTYVKAILFDGQAAIIALGRIQRVPKYVKGDKLEPREVMHVAVSADHRHLDGATVARFMTDLRTYLENPGLMLTQMR